MSGEATKRDQLLARVRQIKVLAVCVKPPPARREEHRAIVALLDELELLITRAVTDEELETAARHLADALEEIAG